MLTLGSAEVRAGAPRRLPHVPLPADGEAFDAWVERTAIALELPTGQTALALGLPTRRGSQPVRPLLFGIVATKQTVAALSASTGLGEEEIRAMHLERFSGTALDLARLDGLQELGVRAVVEREWALLHASRACGHCLAEAGVWPLWWRLGVAAACLRHMIALAEVCPGCGVAFRRGSGRRVRGLSRRGEAGPLRCTNTTADGTVCGFDLTALVHEAVPGELIAIQDRVLETARGGPAVIGGRPATGREFFQALRALAALARSCHAPWLKQCPGAYPEAITAFDAECAARIAWPTGALKLHSMPTSPAAAAALLTLAAPVLLAENGEAALAAVDAWAPAARSATGRRLLQNLPLPDPLRARFAALVPVRHRVTDVGRSSPTRRRAALAPVHIPHLADEGDYVELIAPVMPGVSVLYGRRMASLALARMAGAATWRLAASGLGLDQEASEQLCNRAVKKIERPAAFWSGVEHLADRLVARGLVDYRARRAALACLHEVSAHVLLPTHGGDMMITPARRRLAAAWLWTELTCGDYREAPALVHGWPTTSVASRRTSYGRFAARVPEEWTSVLIEHGTRLLASQDVR